MHSHARKAGLACFLLISILIAGCGGGGSSDSSPPPPAPSGLTYSTPQVLRQNSPMTALTPTVTGSVTSYSVAPAFPAGITLDTATGRISGTPTASPATTNYTITASNSGGSTSFVLSLKVYTVAVDTDPLTRIVAQGTSIYPSVIVRPVNLDVPVLYANAQDATGVILPAVDVAANGDGSFTLQLTTNFSVAANPFTGTLTLNLCRDSACATPLEVPSVTLPFSISVLDTNSTWPGDHLNVLSRWDGVADWSMFQGNASHTGFVPVTVNPDQFTTRWQTAGIPITSIWKPYKQNLVTANGLFYVVSSGYSSAGVVYARRESDSSEVWHYTVTGMSYPSANPAAVGNGVVYFAAGHQSDTYMIGLDAASGSQLFRSLMWSQWDEYYAPTIGPNGMVYANAGTYGGMYAFNPAGNQLFFANQAQQSNWTPAVDSAGVYAYTGGTLSVHDPLTGVVSKQIVDPSYQDFVHEIEGAPVLGAPGSVFVANYWNSDPNSIWGNSLLNFRTDTSSIAWQISGSYSNTPGYKDGVVYAVNNRPLSLEARAESDGTLLWTWAPTATADTQFVSEVLLTRNLAFVSTDHATYAVDLTTHLPVFSYPLSGKLALSANGILYLQNATTLVAINLK